MFIIRTCQDYLPFYKQPLHYTALHKNIRIVAKKLSSSQTPRAFAKKESNTVYYSVIIEIIRQARLFLLAFCPILHVTFVQ